MKSIRALLCLVLVPSLQAASKNGELESEFQKEIRPLLATYCSRCHAPGLRTAGIAFSDFAGHASVVRALSVWVRALRVLREREMPPQGSQPSVEERRALVEWIDAAI